jgi:hypothetical protein
MTQSSNQELISQLKRKIEANQKLINQLNSHNEEFKRVINILETDDIPYESIREVNSSDILNRLERRETHSEYPIDKDLIDKLRYHDDTANRFSSSEEIKQFIKKMEGGKSKKTLDNFAQKLHYLVKNKELIRMKYNNSNKYTFYATRKDWIELKKDTYYIIVRHQPSPELIRNLNDEQKAPENIAWAGL